MSAHANASLASITVGGRSYPIVDVPGCRCCQHPARWEIEQQIVAGRMWANIARDLPEDSGLTARNIKDHYTNGHLPITEPAVVEHIERQSKERGEALAPSVEKVADSLGFATTVLTRVNERLTAREIEPSVRDGLAAAEHLARYSPYDTSADEADYFAAFIRYHECARQIMSGDEFLAFGRMLNADPTLKALSAKCNGRADLADGG